ncbi:MAG: ribosome-binding factor A [Chitinophagaceae bacterium]
MEESKRQKQVSSQIQRYMSEIFQQKGWSIYEGGICTIQKVYVTSDLLEARIYLSLFKIKNQTCFMEMIENCSWEIKKELVKKIKDQLRLMPTLKFFIDDTNEYVEHMENIFKQIHRS